MNYSSLSEVLSLPAEKRTPLLHGMLCTAEYTTGCVEFNVVKHIRRLITRRGGVYQEYYAYPGVSWRATFRSPNDRNAFCRELAARLNREAELMALHPGALGWSGDLANIGSDFHKIGVPITEFEIVNAIHLDRPVSHHRPSHPVRGH